MVLSNWHNEVLVEEGWFDQVPLSKGNIMVVEQVLGMSDVERAAYVARLSAGALGLLDRLLEQYEEEELGGR